MSTKIHNPTLKYSGEDRDFQGFREEPQSGEVFEKSDQDSRILNADLIIPFEQEITKRIIEESREVPVEHNKLVHPNNTIQNEVANSSRQSQKAHAKDVEANSDDSLLFMEQDELQNQDGSIQPDPHAKTVKMAWPEKKNPKKLSIVENSHATYLTDHETSHLHRLGRASKASKEFLAVSSPQDDKNQSLLKAGCRMVKPSLLDIEHHHDSRSDVPLSQESFQAQNVIVSSNVQEKQSQAESSSKSGMNIGQYRKKIVRQNRSVLTMTDWPLVPQIGFLCEPLGSHGPEDLKMEKNLFEEGYGISEFLNRLESVDQESILEMTRKTPDKARDAETPNSIINDQQSISTELSSVDSAELTRMGSEVQALASAQCSGKDDDESKALDQQQHHQRKEFPHSSMTETYHFGSFQRPRSQANMTSRLMMKEHFPKTVQPCRPVQVPLNGKKEKCTMTDDQNRAELSPGESSLEIMNHSPSSSTKKCVRPQGDAKQHKRGNSWSSFEQETPSKKPRMPTQTHNAQRSGSTLHMSASEVTESSQKSKTAASGPSHSSFSSQPGNVGPNEHSNTTFSSLSNAGFQNIRGRNSSSSQQRPAADTPRSSVVSKKGKGKRVYV